MFTTFGFNLGTSPLQVPAPPIFPDYTLDMVDENEDVDAWYTLVKSFCFIFSYFFYIEDNVYFKFCEQTNISL